jgi:hypothetical protein
MYTQITRLDLPTRYRYRKIPQMRKLNPNEMASADLYYSAYLQTAGVEMVRTERDGGRVYFIFNTEVSNIEELKLAWINNSGKIAAQPYAHSIKSLKSLVHMSLT